MDTGEEPAWRAALRALIAHKLSELGPLDTHELARACQVNPDAVAPRMSEMEALGLARDTGRRHSSVSGKGRKLKVWEAIPARTE
ncbi:MAG: hypothetical protein MUF81_06665 [Verrucomicrobia bacterium]|jgi:predicted ArsR family transcriptional regulator|nr:hypothetical protein [Verrucomicrobiota bacterium]